ncbi:Cysteine proteinase 3 [Entamoeba marina]
MFSLLFVVLAVNALDFQQWSAKYGKKFSAVESLRRRAIFNSNARIVAAHNKRNTYKLSLEGPFAAMTNDEYRNLLKSKRSASAPREEVFLERTAPESLDWRSEGKVTPIRDQASCGSCYSFGSLAALEGRLLIEQGGDVDTLDLSEQQMVDCSKKQGNNGCDGGLGTNVYTYIEKNGVMKETDYPYTAEEGSCQYDSSKAYVTMTGYKSVTRKNLNQLKAALVDGLVDVSIDASSMAFQLYKSGVYTDTKCGNGYFSLNHEVCAVGYGASDGVNYVIVRNSWGTTWGDEGYILMDADSNTCGVLTDPIYPVGAAYL